MTRFSKLQGVDLDYEPQNFRDALQQLRATGELAPDALDPTISFFTQAADALAAQGFALTIDVNGGCGDVDCAAFAAIANLTQLNTEDTFGAGSVSNFLSFLSSDNKPLGGKWAPGFEPGNVGVDGFASILRYAAASTTVRHLATWAVHEANVGPQPQGLFDAIEAFLAAP